jgi:Zn finger protein HypA/HybF involved in hydrogenase expression
VETTGNGLASRLEREPAPVECLICRHRQWLSTTSGRCDQCGSGIELFERRDDAQAALDRIQADGRIGYLVPGPRFFAVVSNRTFGGP